MSINLKEVCSLKSEFPMGDEKRSNIVRVLIVEDDPMVAAINKQFTEATDGFCVAGIAKNGDEALTFLDRHQVDLIILDLFLPGKSGLVVLQEIRQQKKPVDVIMITAADDVETVSNVLRQGVVAYIEKPFKFDRFQAVLASYYEFWLKLKQKKTLEQKDIDEIRTVPSKRAAVELPKNFNQQTMLLILQYLMERGEDLSADEVAAGVGLSRTTARRYLEYCQEEGKVERVMSYLAVGRPIQRFRLPS